MKNLATRLVALMLFALVSAVNVAHAGDGKEKAVQLAVVQREGKVVAVHYKKAEKQAVKVKIQNTETNEIVFSDSDKKHEVKVIGYDLSQLPAGTYEITVTIGEKEVKKTVVL